MWSTNESANRRYLIISLGHCLETTLNFYLTSISIHITQQTQLNAIYALSIYSVLRNISVWFLETVQMYSN